MAQSHIATAADYADAMITARRAKHWIFVILLLSLLGQLAIFFDARYGHHIPVAASDTTQPTFGPNAGDAARYFLGLTTFLGVTLSVVMAVVLLLIVMIMVVGRLIGVSRLVSAFIWCLILIVLLFPWQAFLNFTWFKLPGVLASWEEMTHANFDSHPIDAPVILHWARFVLFPLLAVFMLLAIEIKSNRGLRLALGETPIDAESAPVA